jgi:hypothetical protein
MEHSVKKYFNSSKGRICSVGKTGVQIDKKDKLN